MQMLKKVAVFGFLALVMSVGWRAVSAAPAQQDRPDSVILAGTFQSYLGCADNWQPSCGETALQAVDDVRWQATFPLPAGDFEYKVAINDSWTENYGASGRRDGQNIRLRLDTAADVTFIFYDNVHYVWDSVNRPFFPNRDGYGYPAKVVVAGTFQAAHGCDEDWTPNCDGTALQEVSHGVYEGAFDLVAGDYEYKVALNGNWTQNYGAQGIGTGNLDDNFQLAVAAPTTVRFRFDHYQGRVWDSITDPDAFEADDAPVVVDADIATETPPASIADETPLPPNTMRPYDRDTFTYVNVIGSFQTTLGCAYDFDPNCTLTDLSNEASRTDSIYIGAFYLPAGEYRYHVVYVGSRSVSYANGVLANGNDIALVVPSDQWVVFTYDIGSRTVYDSIASPSIVDVHQDAVDAFIAAQTEAALAASAEPTAVAQTTDDGEPLLTEAELADLAAAGIDPDELSPAQAQQLRDYIAATGQGASADSATTTDPIGPPQILQDGDVVQGALDQFGSATYQYNGTAGQVIDVRISGISPVPVMSLSFNDEGAGLSNADSDTLAATLAQSGAYEIFILGEDPGATFELTLNVVSTAVPNDGVLVSGQTVTGYWNGLNDFLDSGEPDPTTDYELLLAVGTRYEISAELGQTISVAADSPDFPPLVILVDPGETFYADITTEPYVAEGTGTYRLYVLSEDYEPGNYTLTVTVSGEAMDAADFVRAQAGPRADIDGNGTSIRADRLYAVAWPSDNDTAWLDFDADRGDFITFEARSDFPLTMAIYQTRDGTRVVAASGAPQLVDGRYVVNIPFTAPSSNFYRILFYPTDAASGATFELDMLAIPTDTVPQATIISEIASRTQTASLDDNGVALWTMQLGRNGVVNVTVGSETPIALDVFGPARRLTSVPATENPAVTGLQGELDGFYTVVLRGEPNATYTIDDSVPVIPFDNVLIENVLPSMALDGTIFYNLGVGAVYPADWTADKVDTFTYSLSAPVGDRSESPLQLFVQFSIDDMFYATVSDPPQGYLAAILPPDGDFNWSFVAVDGVEFAAAEIVENGETNGAFMARQMAGGYYLLGFAGGLTAEDWAEGRATIFSMFASLFIPDNATLTSDLPPVDIDSSFLTYPQTAGSLNVRYLADVSPELSFVGFMLGFGSGSGTAYSLLTPDDITGSLYIFDYSNDEFGLFLMQRIANLPYMSLTGRVEDEWISLNGRPALISRFKGGLFQSFTVTVRMDDGQLGMIALSQLYDIFTPAPDYAFSELEEAFVLSMAATLE